MDYALGKAMGEAGTLAAAALGNKPEEARIGLSKNPELGDLTCAAGFEIAKRRPGAGGPKEIAEEAAKKIRAEIASSSFFSDVSAANGYVNFRFSPAFYALAAHQSGQRDYGRGEGGVGKTAIVEYSSPNVGKPMHVGHIRSTILGEAIARLKRFQGYDVVSSNYLCEAGTQTAKLLLAAKLFGPAEIGTEKELLEYYVRIHKELEAKPEMEEEVRALVGKMEGGDEATLALLRKVRRVSVEPFHRNYEMLGIKFSEEVFDSDYVGVGRALARECVDKGLAFVDKNGETVGDLEKMGLPNLVILRSNGTTLYSTRDLALAQSRWERFHFDSCLIVTASEQNLHFRQVIALLKALGRPYAENYRHLGFGLISLEGGRLSTRAGRVLLLEEVVASAVSMALEEVRKRQEYSEEEAGKIARAVGVAALKYSILRIQAEKDITFRLADAVRFDGNTAAYLQYTCVRAENILSKASAENGGKTGAGPEEYGFNPGERRLAGMLAQFPAVCENAARSDSPAALCNYLFEVATAFSSFYSGSPVLKAESATARKARLGIVKGSANVLQKGLELLSIEVPEKM
ncbi:MAG: arginine--tRNA ligase [Candidatus Micrarchaeota archaeon]